MDVGAEAPQTYTLFPDHNGNNKLTTRTGEEDHAKKIVHYLTNKGYDAFCTNVYCPSRTDGDWGHVTVEGAATATHRAWQMSGRYRKNASMKHKLPRTDVLERSNHNSRPLVRFL